MARGRPVDGVTPFTIEVTATGAVKSTSLVDVAAVRVPAESGLTDGAGERVVVVAHASAPGLESPQTTVLVVLTSRSAGRD